MGLDIKRRVRDFFVQRIRGHKGILRELAATPEMKAQILTNPPRSAKLCRIRMPIHSSRNGRSSAKGSTPCWESRTFLKTPMTG